MNFQDLILNLQKFWSGKGCLIVQPYDVEKGAGTFNPATFFRALGPEPFYAAYVEPCRRPADGRYGENPIRMQHFYQFQVILKPNPDNIQDLYLDSLKAIGIQPFEHDIRFVHDDWETAALNAWGLGWEVWCDGTEITQFTYFQQVGGVELSPITGEITYGLERLCMFLQGADNVWDMQYNAQLTYRDVFQQNEIQFSRYNFKDADVPLQRSLFEQYEKECTRCCDAGIPMPALDFLIKASHAFNLLDSRNALSVNERQGYVLKLQGLARIIAEAWVKNREALGHPLLDKMPLSSHASTLDFKEPPALPQCDTAPLLIELGVEDMPARVFKNLERDLPGLWQKLIKDMGLQFGKTHFYLSPRRIALHCESVSTRQEDKILEIKGPPINIARENDGNWTKAALGFARKNQITPESLAIRKFGKAEYLFVKKFQKGRSALEILVPAIPEFFSRIRWYKTMRWGTGNQTPFVRPVRWLTALLGNTRIPSTFCGVNSETLTRGHRFLSPDPIEITSGNYLEKLRSANVLANQGERKAFIRKQVETLAQGLGLTWRRDEGLLEEVTQLVEYPFPILGHFDSRFLEIPDEVTVTEMRKHQKYFALNDESGKLANAFIAISNMSCKDMEIVRKGYEDVLVSRLRDGDFFLKEDRKIHLADRVDNLKNLVFESSLGTIWDKVQRITRLSEILSKQLAFSKEKTKATSAIAVLAKADLTTAMVFEFPDLQGEVGCYYALQEKLDRVIAEGIRDHYLPRQAGDKLPAGDEAAVVAIADRLDSITGLFGVGKVPTGSSDPFALRRACLGCISILMNRRFTVKLDVLIKESLRLFGKLIPGEKHEALVAQILEFFLSRTKILLQENPRPGVPGGFAYDTIDSVVNAASDWTDLYDLSRRIEAMHQFRQDSGFYDVALTFKRVSHILHKRPDGDVDEALLSHDSEKELLTAVNRTITELETPLREKRYEDVFVIIGALRPSVDKLFDAVLINDPNKALRGNRHRLIQKVKNLVIRVADFAVIQE